MAARITFITGTGTGVGKTLFTAHALHYLRSRGERALAMKPFCSGGTGDVELLSALQDHALSSDLVNPFYFAEPVAPWVVLRRTRRQLGLADVIGRINDAAAECDRLLVEGSGGLLVPLAGDFTVGDVIARLKCEVVVVAKNELGTINHCLLTCQRLEQDPVNVRGLVLMGAGQPDLASKSNILALNHFLKGMPIVSFPWLGRRADTVVGVRRNAKKVEKSIAEVLN